MVVARPVGGRLEYREGLHVGYRAWARAGTGPATPGRVRLPWGSGVAWRVTLYMGSQSLLYYAALTWLSPLFVDAGWTAGRAGLLLGLFSFTQIFSALAVPALADRTGDHRPWIALCVGTTTVMLAAFALVPTAAPWLWAALLGLGSGKYIYLLGFILLFLVLGCFIEPIAIMVMTLPIMFPVMVKAAAGGGGTAAGGGATVR